MLLRTHKICIVLLVLVLVLHPHIAFCTTTTRILKLGVRKDCPPFSYESNEGYRGYSVDLCNKIAEELKAKGYIADYKRVEISARNRFEKLQP